MIKKEDFEKFAKENDEYRAALPNILTGVFSKDYFGTGDNFENGNGNREHIYFIPFGIIFDSNPIVHVGLTGFDLSKNSNQRLVVSVNAIDRHGFHAKFETWNDTKIYHVSINWIAFKNN